MDAPSERLIDDYRYLAVAWPHRPTVDALAGGIARSIYAFHSVSEMVHALEFPAEMDVETMEQARELLATVRRSIDLAVVAMRQCFSDRAAEDAAAANLRQLLESISTVAHLASVVDGDETYRLAYGT